MSKNNEQNQRLESFQKLIGNDIHHDQIQVLPDRVARIFDIPPEEAVLAVGPLQKKLMALTLDSDGYAEIPNNSDIQHEVNGCLKNLETFRDNNILRNGGGRKRGDALSSEELWTKLQNERGQKQELQKMGEEMRAQEKRAFAQQRGERRNKLSIFQKIRNRIKGVVSAVYNKIFGNRYELYAVDPKPSPQDQYGGRRRDEQRSPEDLRNAHIQEQQQKRAMRQGGAKEPLEKKPADDIQAALKRGNDKRTIPLGPPYLDIDGQKTYFKSVGQATKDKKGLITVTYVDPMLSESEQHNPDNHIKYTFKEGEAKLHAIDCGKKVPRCNIPAQKTRDGGQVGLYVDKGRIYERSRSGDANLDVTLKSAGERLSYSNMRDKSSPTIYAQQNNQRKPRKQAQVGRR